MDQKNFMPVVASSGIGADHFSYRLHGSEAEPNDSMVMIQFSCHFVAEENKSSGRCCWRERSTRPNMAGVMQFSYPSDKTLEAA